MRKLFLSAVICFILTDINMAAEEAGATYEIKLSYKAYWAGFVITRVNSTTHIGPSDYRMDVSYKITGLARIFSKMKNNVSARGKIMADGQLRPLYYENTGSWGRQGFSSRTKFRQQDGKILSHDYEFNFKDDYKYIPIEDSLRFGPDMISYYLGMTRSDQAMKINPEVIRRNVFGGFFLLDIAHRCTGDRLLKSRRSVYNGTVRTCEFTDRIIGGNFERVKKRKKRKKKKRSELEPVPTQIWYAKLDELKPLNTWVPVYSEFAVDWGRVRLYLSKIEVTRK